MSDIAIQAIDLYKSFPLYARPADRLKSLLWGKKTGTQVYNALQDVSLTVRKGEVVGIVGRNGAGKSTLLQLLCGTLTPTTGSVMVNGRIAPLLELGAGFNPDFTGRENVFMNAAILGLSRPEVESKLDEIIDFSGVGDFIDQPVKTYSSGMFVRLAFSVATASRPDILIIDEALSVGDGAFARKSFERIMRLKENGATILFCSHSMYQVEAICSKAYWLEKGRIKLSGNADFVTSAYGASLNAEIPTQIEAENASASITSSGYGRIVNASIRTENQSGKQVSAHSGTTDVHIKVQYVMDPNLPSPGIAVGISDSNGLTIASAGTVNDGFATSTDSMGHGSVELTLRRIPLLKGAYFVTVFLTTEDGVHPYDQIENCLRIDVTQTGLEQGVVSLPHVWALK